MTLDSKPKPASRTLPARLPSRRVQPAKQSKLAFRWRLLAGGLALLTTGVFSADAQSPGPLDLTQSGVPWTFSNGPEFPGGVGFLTHLHGSEKNVSRLTFDNSKGGNYVSASCRLPVPLPAEAVSLRVRHRGGVSVQVRVIDGSGQTLHYVTTRPFQATDASQWVPLTVKLGSSELHWGGLNDGVFHNPLVEVSVVAKAGLSQAGAVDFTSVQILPTLALRVDPAARAVPTGVPDLPGSTGVEIEHVEAVPADLDLTQALGFKRVRTEMFWTDIERVAGVYDFSWYDVLTRALAQRGLRADFIICYGNALYTGTDWFQPPLTPGARQGCARFARAAAAHFAGQGVRFEAWNEPDNPTFWAKPSPGNYAALASAVIAGVHAGDPAAKVTTGGLAGIKLGFLRDVLRAGGGAGADAIALHPYRKEAPELLADDLAEVRTRLPAFTGSRLRSRAIWSTEAGYSSAWYGDGSSPENRTKQAKFCVRQVLTLAALGVPSQTVFALHDHGTDFKDPEQNFGVTDFQHQPKPLTPAMRTLLTQCQGREFLGNVPTPESSLHILKFRGPTGVLLVLWTDLAGSGDRQVSFASRPGSAMDYLGQPLPLADTMPVGDAPVYVLFPEVAGK